MTAPSGTRSVKRIAIADLLAVDKNRHVLAQFAVVFKNVAAGPFIRSKICVQHFPERGAGDVERRAFDVTLNVASEANGRHPEMINEPASLFRKP